MRVTIDGTAFVNGCCNPADPATQVARFNGTDWTVYSTADGLPADTSNRSLVVTRDGVVWLSTTAAPVCRLEGNLDRLWHELTEHPAKLGWIVHQTTAQRDLAGLVERDEGP